MEVAISLEIPCGEHVFHVPESSGTGSAVHCHIGAERALTWTRIYSCFCGTNLECTIVTGKKRNER